MELPLGGFCSAGWAVSSCAKEIHSKEGQKEYGNAFC